MSAPRFLTLEAGAVVVAGAAGLVERHIWSPASTYYLLLVLVVLDVVTNNLVAGQRLVPRNLALRLAAYTVLLAFAHGFSEHEKGLFFLSQLTIAPFIIVHLRRLIISFAKLGLVDQDVSDLLQRRITRAVEAEPAPVEPLPQPIAEPVAEPNPSLAP